jgi:glycosyltransferase involved in cell wall biosynthesis
VVHESLACGTPAVATDVGAVRDLIPSAAHGSVVPRDDQAALEDALAWALEAEWDRTAIAARAGARTWERVAREVLSELEDAVAGRPAAHPLSCGAL